jgi:glycerol-3-phosphate dehydrogenase (NAD(P)+)
MNRLAVIGGGSWGTALAITLAPRFERVRIWVYEEDLAARMQSSRVNDLYLPGFSLPANLEAGCALDWAVQHAGIVLSVTPSHHTRGIYERLREHVRPEMLFVSATKGLEGGTLLRQTEVMSQVLEPRFAARTGALSGPTFAREVAAGDPAAIVIASRDAELASEVQRRFAGPTFRLYTNPDPVGVEVGASLKNVIAIAAGMCQGLGLGSNSMAALVTRGLAEISRLAVAAGGQARTMAGLAGLGDLVLTCNGELSRNRQVGFRLGRGETLADVLASMRMVAEGVKTTSAALEMAARLQVELPITRKVQEIFDGRPPREALRDLMERRLTGE